MPEITAAELTEYHQYKAIAPTPSEVTRKIEDLVKDNGKQRDELREAKDKLKALPPEGAVILTGDEAAAWPKYQALGKPEDLEKVAGERDELAKKDALRTREDGFRAAVEAMGWPKDSVATLLDMGSLNGAVIEVKSEEIDDKGKKVKQDVAYVTLPGEGQKPQKFSEFAATSPALKGIRTEDAGGGGGTPGGGIPYTEQGSGGGRSAPVSDDKVRESVERTVAYTL